MPAPRTEGTVSMVRRAVARLSPIALGAILLSLVSSCGDSPTAPTPVLQTETFTGTLQPLGIDYKTFAVVYAQSSTDLSVIVNSLTTVASSTPVTGITIGVGFGSVSGSTCSLQVQTPVANLGQELLRAQRRFARDLLRPDVRLPDRHDWLHVSADRGGDLLDDGQALLRVRARASRSSRSRSLRVRSAARSNSARASSSRPRLASRSPRTAGRRW